MARLVCQYLDATQQAVSQSISQYANQWNIQSDNQSVSQSVVSHHGASDIIQSVYEGACRLEDVQSIELKVSIR
jgi:hypothetical protein